MRHFRRMSLETSQLLITLILVAVPYLFWQGQGFALELADRSVSISTATPSAIANHIFTMDINSGASIGSITFEYCSNSPIVLDPCTAPSGLSLSGAVLSNQTNNTGFSIDSASSSI